MYKQELLALCALLIIVIGFPMSVFAYQYVYLPTTHGEIKVIDLVARAPEAGGWDPEYITVNRGDTVRLRIAAHDVVHGFAIGKLGIDVGSIIPGEVATVEFVANEVGQFTYYCNVWCSPYHYRMRGTLEVVDPADPDAFPMTEEGVDFSELDIDSPHEVEFYPANRPSAARGRALSDQIELPALGDLRSQSPSAVFQTIREGEAAASLSDEEVWDLVAYLWSSATTPEQRAQGETLYAKNCAACHGETGGGDGPGGRYLEEQPIDFTDARTMAGGSSEIYYAKIRRGGMGTGMPYWGTIFTEEETWSIVDYLWTFLFRDAETE
ncbi:MAG: c-type cytochrome [Anaerolineales bacterium]|nr:MAG: c-type cytochrome [Anaerolineales bacterium]